jgi:hypothetical protein
MKGGDGKSKEHLEIKIQDLGQIREISADSIGEYLGPEYYQIPISIERLG